MSAPSVIEQQLVFTLDDPKRSFVQVGLDCDDALAGPRHFRRTASGWTLALPRPDVARVEYRLVLTSRSGQTSVVCDPGNPERVRTAFGERSVALMPGYERPTWLRRDVEEGVTHALSYSGDAVGELPVTVWSPAGLAATTPAPMLVVNDGPEYADLAELGHYASVMVDTAALPPFRMALMQPVERDEWYGANPVYIGASIGAVRSVTTEFSVQGPFVLMGASLGGLCALLTACAAPSYFAVAAVFSQSGSFFQPDLDPQESSYPYFERVTAAVHQLRVAGRATRRLRVGMTCGSHEENLANNRVMAEAMTTQGHDVVLREVPDLHNFTAWRDALDPTLTEVLRRAWGARG
jgi:enterochelin esterase-like enzyme